MVTVDQTTPLQSPVSEKNHYPGPGQYALLSEKVLLLSTEFVRGKKFLEETGECRVDSQRGALGNCSPRTLRDKGT